MDGSHKSGEKPAEDPTENPENPENYSDNWLYTPKGEKRGYIQPHTLKELWFHTGTACNLSCPFCL